MVLKQYQSLASGGCLSHIIYNYEEWKHAIFWRFLGNAQQKNSSKRSQQIDVKNRQS